MIRILSFSLLQLLFALGLLASEAAQAPQTTVTLNVSDWGVVGDGIHDDTAAMRRLLQHRCGPCHKHIVIPAHYMVRTFPLNLTSHTTLQVDGTLVATPSAAHWPIMPPVANNGDSEDTWSGLTVNQYQSYLYAVDAVDIRITGSGVIDGSGPYWWKLFKDRDPVLQFGGRPNLLQTVNVTNLEIDTVIMKDSPFWTVHPMLSRNIYIHHMKIRAPLYAPNIDGIDPDSCQDVLVEYNDVACGDDHIAIKAGVCGVPNSKKYHNHCTDPDWIERSKAYLTRNVTIRHNVFRTGMGIAVGSATSGSVKDVFIYNNTIGVCEAGSDDQYKSCGWGPALHLKTTITRSGVIDNVVFDNNTIYNNSMFIFLETNYQVQDQDLPADYPKTKVQNIYFQNNRAVGHATAATFHCDAKDPCHNITVVNNTIVNAQGKNPWKCNFIESYHVADNVPDGLEECMANSMNKTSDKDDPAVTTTIRGVKEGSSSSSSSSGPLVRPPHEKVRSGR